jgi:hypothetical protein
MLGEFGAAQGAKRQPLHPRPVAELGQPRRQRMTAVYLVGPVACHQQHPTSPEGLVQERHQLPGGGIGPVQVLKHQHDRGMLRQAQQQRADRIKQLQLFKPLPERGGDGRLVGQLRQQPAKTGQAPGRRGQQLVIVSLGEPP